MAEWDEESDLVVIGFGGAGAAAAITAHDLGTKVLVVEKQDALTHTPSTRMSGGYIMAVVGELDAAIPYMDTCADGSTPIGVTRAWATEAQSVISWVNALSPEFRVEYKVGPEHPELEGAESLAAFAAPGQGAGYDLFQALEHAVSKRGIDVKWRTPARRLIKNESGNVIGVVCEHSGREIRLRARKGVLLACGGFEFNDGMKRDFLPAYPMHFYGNPGNTGDGITMAQNVGASLWHMTQVMGRGMGHFESLTDQPLNFSIILALSSIGLPCDPFGYVITDRYGRRFANEYPQALGTHAFNYHLLAYDPERHEYPRIPCFLFFDDRRFVQGPLTPTAQGLVRVGIYEWSKDNQKEVAKGWISKGNTIAEVAAAAGVADPVAAERSVEAYNRSCRERSADSFGRPEDTMVPLESPFYCLKLWPGGTNTLGGPRRNEHAQILDPFGEPIGGLYGAGELGSAIGRLYPAGGSSISDALCFGQIAGRHVSARP